MTDKRLFLTLSSAALLALSACAAPYDEDALAHHAHYWQRANTTDATYQRGPKAQQMLNQDIARCITELKELERTGALRHALPGNTENGWMPDPETPEGLLAEYDTPERDGALRYEHLEYHDFEGCMINKGWERIKSVPYDVAAESRETYLETILGEKYQSKYGDNASAGKEGDYDGLNE
ncbi:MAG: hypothetical protein H6868_09060 [Rhodospirillales bacterium]|nr:hypothetical protein [Rhodospirillales bacterium]